MKSSLFSRRSVLGGLVVAGGSIVLAPRSVGAETPRQTEGPFHPTNIGADLARRGANDPLAQGQVIRVVGTVRDDGTGAAIDGAVVELWQADHQGKYSHPSDPLPLTPDPDFQFFGRAVTDASGRYAFRSIKPGAYPAAPGWDRPPHLHVKIARRGYHEVITQMYFAGEALNGADLILGSLTAAQRAMVTVAFAPVATQTRPGVPDLQGTFDIELARVVLLEPGS